MKAITVRQPWAQLIVDGRKTIETRPRPTYWRGRVLIHAGKTWDARFTDWVWVGWEHDPLDCQGVFGCDVDQIPGARIIESGAGAESFYRVVFDESEWPLGAIVGSAMLVDCLECQGRGHCDPIPARGQQAVPWNWRGL